MCHSHRIFFLLLEISVPIISVSFQLRAIIDFCNPLRQLACVLREYLLKPETITKTGKIKTFVSSDVTVLSFNVVFLVGLN